MAFLLNLVAFFQQGRFPSLAERLVGMSMVNDDVGAGDGRRVEGGGSGGGGGANPIGAPFPSAGRSINFQFMNRQLLWEGMSRFFLFVVSTLSTLPPPRPPLMGQSSRPLPTAPHKPRARG